MNNFNIDNQEHSNNSRDRNVRSGYGHIPQTRPSSGSYGTGGYRPPKPKKKGVAGALVAMALVAGICGGGAGWFAANGALGVSAEKISAEQTAHTGIVQLSSTTTGVAEIPLENIDESAANGTISSVAEQAGNSVVEISVSAVVNQPFAGQAISEGQGSGVVFSKDGYIITNNHVVQNATDILVTTKDGSEYSAQLIGTDEQTDLAVIKIQATGLHPASLADSTNLKVGELAVAIGNPLGELGGTVTSGIVSSTARDISISGENMTLIQTSAAVNPGNSGGGLFNKDGKLIGIVNAKLAGSEIEGLAFAIPANTVSEIINEIIENGYVTGRSELGIELLDVLDEMTAMQYRLSEYGVYVSQSDENKGLAAGDIITAIDGNKITQTADINKLLLNYKPGDEVKLDISRNGNSGEVLIILAEQS